MIIYKITNKLTNKVYIGQTTKSLHTRLYHHFYNSKKANCYFGHAINKYGKENFIAEEICSAKNLNDLNYLEEYFIKYYNSLMPNGYNIVLGGNNFKRVCGPMEGKTHSEDTKKKMSKSAMGKTKSSEHCLNISKSKKGTKYLMINAKIKGYSKKGCPIICNETGESFISVLEASRQTGIYRTKIVRQLTGKVKNTKWPLTFQYINKEEQS